MNSDQQQGFTLIILICTIVFLSLMAMVAFRFTLLSQQQVNLSLLSARAQMAAKSALEIAIISYEKNPQSCPSQNITFDKTLGTLEGFDIHISCEEAPKEHSVELSDSGVYLNAEAIYKDPNSQKVLINYKTGQWVPFPS